MHTKAFSYKSIKFIAVFTTVLFILSLLSSIAFAEEEAEAVYYGMDNASTVLNNLDYSDVKNSNTWAKEAIYEAGALGILKGFGNRQFGRTNTLSKEEALAIAYRVAGREADAQKAGEALDNARMQDDKKTDALGMWSDGYLQLAANEGLITRQDLNDALSTDQAELEPESFNRRAPAERQEMAFWMAKVLELEPVYEQQELFNSYNDWKSADPVKVPYIEAVVQNNIMNGDGRGNFSPGQPITREQAAQIVKNAASLILPAFGLSKNTGTVENISVSRSYSEGVDTISTVFNIRSGNGQLHKIITEQPESIYRNEQNGRPLSGVEKDFVVYKSGEVGSSSLLDNGDRVEYIVDGDNTVRYVKAVPGTAGLRYFAAQINSIDTETRMLDVHQFFELNSPDLEALDKNVSFNMEGENINASYSYSSSVSVMLDGDKADIGELGANLNVILTIQNNNVVVGIKTADFGINPGEKYIVKGIVEDNNPQLGYITLYNEDGSGNSPDSWEQLALFRTYNYINQNDVEVFRNHEKADIDDIEPGDTVFIKTDNDGNVISISGVENYTVKYARVISKAPSSMVVEYDDGVQQVLDVDDNVLLIKNSKLTGYSGLKDGDRVKLMLHITNKFTKIKEITIEDEGHLISNVFKGIVSHIDGMSNKVVVLNLEELNGGKWVRSEQKGFIDIKLSDDCSIYHDNIKVDANTVNKYLKSNEAYIAVMQDYGGKEKAVLLSFRNGDDTELLYNDSIANSYAGSDRFSLSKEYNKINLNNGSIIVKDGRLVSASSISIDDMAYVVANRSYNSGEYNAGIVEIKHRSDNDSIQIYRGRITGINDNSDFTVESFTRLEGINWRYYNTPKTFKLTHGTRIIGENGLINQRNFTDYSEDNYIGNTVYVVTGMDGINAVLVSTAPYGIYNIKGEIYQVVGGSTGEDGSVLEEPAQINIRNARVYDQARYMWTAADNMEIGILSNSIILKNNSIIKPSKLRKGDIVRIIKKDGSTGGDGYIIILD